MKLSNSKKKMDVTVGYGKGFDKKWAKVFLKHSRTFYPSFEDLYRIVQAICFCEDEKYPNGKGREMVKEFLIDAVDEPRYDVLRQKYQIPERAVNVEDIDEVV